MSKFNEKFYQYFGIVGTFASAYHLSSDPVRAVAGIGIGVCLVFHKEIANKVIEACISKIIKQ